MSDKIQISVVPEIHKTAAGTPYLKYAGVSPIAVPSYYANGMVSFINGFDDFNGDAYMNDQFLEDGSPALDEGELLCKTAGQVCYLSLGEQRTKNAEAKKYFDNIKSSGHGSVLEHANYSLMIWGIDRSVTHEMVRHRAGFGFSQVSQRYVSGKMLRFVERPEFQNHEKLHAMFEESIDAAVTTYDHLANVLREVIDTTGMTKTEARKAVNQAARARLPNETEAPIVVTANCRAWRNFLDQRGNEHADRPIQGCAISVYRVLLNAAPILFDDYVLTKRDDGREFVSTKYRKV